MELGIRGLEGAEVVGTGGSAVVYRARQSDLDREVAVKVLKLTDESFVRRFQREARTLGRLSQHPGIVTIYDNGVTGDGHPYLILEFCESSLHDQMQSGPMPVRRACEVLAEVAEAVAAAHDDGVVHRDLKPGNILISPTGRHLVADFGISAVAETSASDTGSIGFTAGYVAPEILIENEAETPADVYALGATLFHLASGHPPFVQPGQSPNLFAIAHRVISDPVPDLADDGVDPRVAKIVRRAMSKAPDRRPTASELAVELRELVPLLDEQQDDAGSAPASDPEPERFAANLGGVLEGGVDPTEVGAGSESATTAKSSLGHEIDSDAERQRRRDLRRMLVGVAAIAIIAPVVLGVLASRLGPSASSSEDPGVAGGALDALAAADVGDDDSLSVASGGLTGASDRFDIAAFADTSVEVPDVVGLDVAEARSALESIGLAVAVTSRRTSTVAPNAVLETTPQAGDVVEVGSVITVVVARQDSTSLVVVPEVVGETEAAARALLDDVGLTALTTYVPLPTSEAAEGTVVGATPTGGSEVEEGSAVRLVVSSGPICPDQVGQAEAEAVASLQAVGLSTTSTRAQSATVAEDLVISCTQDGSNAALVISSGPPPDPCSGIVGLTRADAVDRLEPLGLPVNVVEASDTAPAGEVVGCILSATAIGLTVSSGPAPPECPAVRGKPEADATADIIAAGFETVTTSTAFDDDVPEGDAVSCAELSATEAELVLSDGPDDDIVVPNLDGLTLEEANNELQAIGLSIGGVDRDPNSNAPPETVVGANPTYGTRVAPGTAVTLVLAGAVTVSVPNVIGSSEAIAVDTLTNIRLSPTVVYEIDGTVVAGTVTKQSVAAGTIVDEGTGVTVTVAQAP